MGLFDKINGDEQPSEECRERREKLGHYAKGNSISEAGPSDRPDMPPCVSFTSGYRGVVVIDEGKCDPKECEYCKEFAYVQVEEILKSHAINYKEGGFAHTKRVRKVTA